MGHPKPTGPPKGASTLPRPEGAQTLQHPGGARLTREEQGRESPLGEDGKLARSASERGGAHRLRRRGVLPQERQNLRAEPPASFHLCTSPNFKIS